MRASTWAAIALCVALAGCADETNGGTPAGTTTATSTSASAEAVGWMGRFCGAVRDLQRDIFAGASNGGSSPDELRRALSQQLGAAGEGLGAAARKLGELGQATVEGGDAAATVLRDRYESLREDVVAVKGKMDALPGGSGEGEVGAVMGEVWPKVVAAVNGAPFKDIEITRAMRDAGGSGCGMVAGWPR